MLTNCPLFLQENMSSDHSGGGGGGGDETRQSKQGGNLRTDRTSHNEKTLVPASSTHGN